MEVSVYVKDIKEHIDKYGLVGIEEFATKKLEEWKGIGITICVTGEAGAGKSSFINAFRGLKDDDEGAAETGVTETTYEPTEYFHPTNNKIKFWDLPGIGTPGYPDLETYYKKTDFETYDTFLIFTDSRFTIDNLKLARKVKSLGKSFFFVRAKIDQDMDNQKRKKEFNEESTLKDITDDCWRHLKDLAVDQEDVFLISNFETAKWDFPRLTQAILDALPLRQKESVTLSLTSFSRELVKRKVEVLRGRIWMVAVALGFCSSVLKPELSVAININRLTNEVNSYKSQLGLPEENSTEFDGLTQDMQMTLRKYALLTSTAHLAQLIATYRAEKSKSEEDAVPYVGSIIAGSASFGTTSLLLRVCLNELEETALKFVDETSGKVADKMDLK